MCTFAYLWYYYSLLQLNLSYTKTLESVQELGLLVRPWNTHEIGVQSIFLLWETNDFLIYLQNVIFSVWQHWKVENELYDSS